MTTKELERRIKIIHFGRRDYSVRITYKGKEYFCNCSNTFAYDRIKRMDNFSKNAQRTLNLIYTYKQALQALYKECKTVNNLK